MKDLLFSIKNSITAKGWLWIGILFSCAILYYLEFFKWYYAIFLALYITIIIVSMLLVGYIRLGSKSKFHSFEFLIYVALFSILRTFYIILFLSKHLPEHTLFHYPYRSIPSVIFGSAAMIFLGYSYAIYEWGLAAREKYLKKSETLKKRIEQPIKLRSSGKSVYVLSQDIIYLNAKGEYVDYNTNSKKYTCFKRFKVAEAEMKHYGFLRTHRSYIINPIYVESIGVSEIMLRNEITIPLSKKYRKSVCLALEKVVS